MKISLLTISIGLLLGFTGCATNSNTAPSKTCAEVAGIDAAYRRLPSMLLEYNSGLRKMGETLERSSPSDFVADLATYGVAFDFPNIGLPLHHVEIPDSSVTRDSSIGIPVVLGYETKNAPLYPPEGLFVDATMIYDRGTGHPRLSLRARPSKIKLNGHSYEVAVAPTAASEHLKTRAKRLAGTGFISMIRPASMKRKAQIYLLEPYDPNKAPLLMVHGLQSTPVAFATLVNALRGDPVVRAKYQIWQFYYPSGTPVLANATLLRDSLNTTFQSLDPRRQDAASQRVVVIGHSMGGVISHTLVSSSGEKLWDSVFRVPASQLKGNPASIRALAHFFYFRKDPRVGRVIFMAAPHRGSAMADSLIGKIGNSLARLSPLEETGFTNLARDNAQAMRPEAAKFYDGGRFSAVRTLSPRSTALVALAGLPISIPYHSVIGQVRDGPKEHGSDGVVPYASSHLDGAASELIVRSGHGVIGNPDAIAEVIRILHSDQTTKP